MEHIAEERSRDVRRGVLRAPASYHGPPVVEPGESLPRRVVRTLQRELELGNLRIDDRLPGEPRLAQLLGVSRATLREALRLLEADGIIGRRDGIGTFITRAHATPLVTGIEELCGVTELIRRAGFEPRVRDVTIKTCDPPEHVQTLLGLDGSERVYRLSRLYLAGDTPAMLAEDFLALCRDEDTGPVERFDGQTSLYELLRRAYDLRIDTAVAEVLTTAADDQHATLMHISAGYPLLVMKQTHIASNGRRVFCSENFHNTDVLRFRVVRRRRSHEEPRLPGPSEWKGRDGRVDAD